MINLKLNFFFMITGKYAGEAVSFIRACTGLAKAGSVENWKKGTNTV